MSEETTQNWRINDGWLITETLCIRTKDVDMGINAKDFWMPIFIRIDEIIGAKLACLDEDDESYLMTTIYMRGSNDYFTININFNTFKKEVMKL